MNCPVCQKFKKTFKQIAQQYFQCCFCRSIFQHPLPDSETISAYYESYKNIKFKMNPGYLTNSNFNNYKNIMELTLADLQINRSFFIGKNILDVGCANGDFLMFLKEKNIQAAGIDISHDLVKIAQARDLDVKKEKVENLRQNYEIISCWDVIEHIADPLLFVNHLKRILINDGYLFISTPVVGLVAGFFGEKWRFLMPDEHLCLFSRKSIFQVLVNEGWEILRYVRFGSGFTSGMIISPVKQIFDKLAKKWQIGDRIVILCRKTN